MREEFWLVRARRGGLLSYKDRMTLMYLARIAVKSEVDSSEFHRCVVEAWNQEESKCEQLSIRCREKTGDSAIFLFTTGSDVVAQFPIPTTILEGTEAHARIRAYMKMFSARHPAAKKVVNPKIKDLKPGMKNINLRAEVIEIPKPYAIYTKYGTGAVVSNALISDETGKARLTLWSQQIKVVSEGAVVKIENARAVRYRGELQLRLGRRGNISVVE